MKKLYKSKNDRKLTGLLGGLGEYLNIDPTLLRLFFLFLVVFTGFFPGVVLYIVAAAIVPEAPASKK